MSTPDKDVRIKQVVENIRRRHRRAHRRPGHHPPALRSHQRLSGRLAGMAEDHGGRRLSAVDGEHGGDRRAQEHEILSRGPRPGREEGAGDGDGRRASSSHPGFSRAGGFPRRRPSASARQRHGQGPPTWTARWPSSAASARPTRSGTSSPATSSVCRGRTSTATSSARRCRDTE